MTQIPSRHALLLSGTVLAGLMVLSPAALAQAGETDEDTDRGEADQTAGDIETMLVIGERGGRYQIDTAGTGLRKDMSVLDVPASVQVIPEALMEDTAAFTVDAALRNVSGVTFISGGEGAQLFSRGFSTQVLRDGFLRTEFTDGDVSPADLNTVNLERIEVLKGPASVLYGRGNPGGVINLITKTPKEQPFASFALNAGSFDQIRGTGDISMPLLTNQGPAARAVGSYEESGSFRDQVQQDILLAAPTLSWQAGSGTRFTLGAEYARVRRTPDDGVLRDGDDILEGQEIDTFLNEPDDLAVDERVRVMATADHRVNQTWRVRARAVYSDTTNETATTQAEALQADGETVSRSEVQSNFAFRDARFMTEVTANFDVAGFENELLFGVDYANRQTEVLFAGGPADAINAFNPQYGMPGPNDDFFFTFVQDSERNAVGAFVQNQVSLTKKLTLVGGLRYDYIDQGLEGGLVGNTSPAPEKTDDGLSPRVGLVYRPNRNMSLYAQWSRSFQQVNSSLTNVDGEVLEPERGRLFEVGTKIDLGGITATLAAFDIQRDNVVNPDLNNPGFQIAAGEQESQGIELDFAGQPLRGWNINFAYAFIDAEIVASTQFDTGNRLQDIPRHSLNLFSTYEIPSGPLENVGFGGGIEYLSNRAADAANSFFLSSFVRANAVAFYTWRDRIKFQFNVRNLTDERIILNATGDNTVAPAEPRTFIGTVSVTF